MDAVNSPNPTGC